MEPRVSGKRRALAWRLALCGFAGPACGPSFEAIQEGDLRFAHCDRLDIDPNIAASHRLHCWREWRRVYTYGQTRDRVEYAQRRIAEVVSGDTEPPFELPSGPSGASVDPLPQPPAVVPIEPAPAPAPVPSGGQPEGSGSERSVPSGVGPGSSVESTAAPAGAAAKATRVAVEPECRARCEAELNGCLPGCETKPTGCAPCEPSLEACLGLCGAAQ